MLNVLPVVEPGLLAPTLAEAIRAGLRQRPRRLPAACLYDAVGSTLFEAITQLPEYGLTSAEQRLLDGHARAIAADLRGPLDVIELGPGSGRKARRLFEAAPWPGPIRYRPIDISPTALDACRDTFCALPSVRVEPIEGTFEDGLLEALSSRRRGARALVLFLGSNLGNFERGEVFGFLGDVHDRLLPGDALLIGADLQKDPARLSKAYDDPAGVTAAFDRNVLVRLNRELGADFDVARFGHRVVYDARRRRVEMHLVALEPTLVALEALGLRFSLDRGETIWTESSHKFDAGEIAALGGDAGFEPVQEWIDAEWPYGLHLLRSA